MDASSEDRTEAEYETGRMEYMVLGFLCAFSGAIAGCLFAGEIRLALGSFAALFCGSTLGWYMRGGWWHEQAHRL